VLLLGTILLVGVLVGLGLGGSPRNLAEAKVRLWWLIPVALALQLIPVPREDEGLMRLLPVGALLASYVLLIVVALMNWRLWGFLLILLGLILNFTVIGMNHGMPVSVAAIRASGHPELLQGLTSERGTKHHRADNSDVLLPIADVIAFREPFGVVVSAGDLLIDAGGAVFLAAAMLGRPERQPRRRSRPQQPPQEAMWGTPR
jgi:Family of unknown function (DUF5317)